MPKWEHLKKYQFKKGYKVILPDRVCPVCKGLFKPHNHLHIFCSKKCWGKHYYYNNIEKCRKWSLRCYHKHREEYKKRGIKYYYEHRQEMIESNRIWREKNRENRNESVRTYRNTTKTPSIVYWAKKTERLDNILNDIVNSKYPNRFVMQKLKIQRAESFMRLVELLNYREEISKKQM